MDSSILMTKVSCQPVTDESINATIIITGSLHAAIASYEMYSIIAHMTNSLYQCNNKTKMLTLIRNFAA